MKLTPHIHQRLRLKNGLLTLVLLALLICLAWASRFYSKQIDLTANNINTLSVASQKILLSLPKSIKVTAYISDKTHQKQISQLLALYLRFKKNIELNFIDPNLDPVQARKLNIGAQGAVLVEYLGRTEKLQFLDESTFSNALLQLANTDERWITFLAGHGERSPLGKANFDLGMFGKRLEDRNIKVQSFNLVQFPTIPDNSSLLVLSSPTVPLLAKELNIISDYIRQGGNLLLLTDPNNPHLKSIENQLGIYKLPGTIVDSSSGLYGIDNPSFVLIKDYPAHPVTANFNSITVFPISAGLEIDEESHFSAEALISSVPRSWTESGEIAGKIRFDPDSEEVEGPLTLAYALTREFSTKNQQRVIVVGDADFLSNSFLDNVGNSEFGFRLINWLTHDDRFIEIPAKNTPGKSLHLTTTSVAIIGFGFLIVLPLLLILTGFVIWRKRKQR